MKPSTLPDGFAVVFIWCLLAVEIAIAVAMPQNVDLRNSIAWFIPCLAIAWTAAYIGMQQFRNKYKEEYEELGSPQIFGTPYERKTWRFISYLLTFRFIRLADPIITGCFSVFLGLTAIALVLLLSKTTGA